MAGLTLHLDCFWKLHDLAFDLSTLRIGSNGRHIRKTVFDHRRLTEKRVAAAPLWCLDVDLSTSLERSPPHATRDRSAYVHVKRNSDNIPLR
jgi:hypothetical protein